jgi:phosphatidylglycerophosphatase A
MSVEKTSPSATTRIDAASAAAPSPPRLPLLVATSLGLGYLPKAPGTWGSLAGILVYAVVQVFSPWHAAPSPASSLGQRALAAAWTQLPVALLLAALGTWAAGRAEKYTGKTDPQFVVIDEVSGQHLTYLLALAPLNWQYLLAGFILFRVFDIWKPFPARQAESLPGGLGIMADDWIAGGYAALALWLVQRWIR